jgi:hypothetical protein
MMNLSECVITKSYNLIKFKRIIHTILPKFNSIYHNACESSLHLAMRNVFDICIQSEISSVCFGPELFKPSKNFPIQNAIAINCRTMRKCMEKLKGKISKVVIVIGDVEIYEKLRENFKMYFPRTKQEEMFYAKYLPNILETEYGDVILPERCIAVKSNFTCNEKEDLQEDEIDDIKYKNEIQIEKFYYKGDDIQNYEMY